MIARGLDWTSTQELGTLIHAEIYRPSLSFESYVLMVLYHALKLFRDHGLLQLWLGCHLRKQNSIDRLLHSPMFNNSAADIKKKEARHEKKARFVERTS